MKNSFLLIALTTAIYAANGQVGVRYDNLELSNYAESMKAPNFTYLIWDKNNGGNGMFSADDRPSFMYFDNDQSVFGYLLDTRNMTRLKANFYSLNLSNDMTVPTGSASIGTADIDPNYRLSVQGKVRAEEVRVEAAPWPDYVFEPDYDLTSLEELEQFIQTEKHLPEIPSADEIANEGLALGEMNRLLLQKVEELTLHLIEKDKEVASLVEAVEMLNQQVDLLANEK